MDGKFTTSSSVWELGYLPELSHLTNLDWHGCCVEERVVCTQQAGSLLPLWQQARSVTFLLIMISVLWHFLFTLFFGFKAVLWKFSNSNGHNYPSIWLVNGSFIKILCAPANKKSINLANLWGWVMVRD